MNADLPKWGAALAVILALFGRLAFSADLRLLAGVLWAAAALVLVLAWARPPALAPLRALLDDVMAPLRAVVGTVVLAGIFFGLVTPLGWLLRGFGRIGDRSQKPTYWIRRDASRDDPNRAFRQS